MAVPKPILLNTLHLTIAAVLRKAIILVYFVIVARYAGLNVTGLFYLVICYGALFSAVVDLGLTNTFIRDASREPARLEELLSRTLSLKLTLAVVGMLSIAALLQILDYPPITNRLIAIVVVTVVLESFGTTFFACYRVHRDMRPEAAGMVLGGLATLALGAMSVALGLSPYFLIIAIALDSLVNFAMGWFLVSRRLKVTIRISLRPHLSWHTIAVGLPFALSALFIQVYAFDAVVLQRFMGETFVALYSVAARPVASLRFVPMMLAVALFPTFSHLYRQDRTTLRLTLLQSQYVMLLASVPLVVWAVCGGDTIITMIFGAQYSSSIDPFRVMALSLIPVFVTAPALAVLNACNAQVIAALNVGAAIVVHAALSVWLIPTLGVNGAAIASTVSASVLAASCWYSGHRVARVALRSLVPQVLKVSVAAAAMAGLLVVGDRFLPFAALIVPSGALYIALVYLVEGFDGFHFSPARARRRLLALGTVFLRNPPDPAHGGESAGQPVSSTVGTDL